MFFVISPLPCTLHWLRVNCAFSHIFICSTSVSHLFHQCLQYCVFSSRVLIYLGSYLVTQYSHFQVLLLHRLVNNDIKMSIDWSFRLSDCLSSVLLAVFWQKIFYIHVGFIKNLSSNSIWLILACKLKLNCHDLRRVIFMTSSSN